MTENNVSRRAFAGMAGSAGMFGLAGALGALPRLGLADAADETVNRETLEDIQAREREAAKAEGRHLDPVKFVTNLTKDELDAMLNDETEVTEDYVTPGGKVIPAIYVRLRNRINRCAAGLGSIVSGDDHWDVLMNFLTEEDAAHILEMPLTKAFCAAEYAEKTGRSEAEALEILDDLADRSWLWRIRRGGQGQYMIMAQIPGYWEWHELWEGEFGTDERTLEFNHGCDSAWGEDNAIALLYRPQVHVQACDNEIVDGAVPPFADWHASLERFDHFGVMPCQCRTKQKNYGLKTDEECGRMETCVSMGEIAEFFTSIGVARELTRDEAREIMELNVEEGNTIEGFCTKSGGAYCACNINVCLFANAYKASGGKANSMEHLSDFNLAYDKDACIKCGACQQRCPMNAIEVDEDGYYVATAMCFRCGQCAMTCPAQARKLVAKEKWETFERADDLFDDSFTAARVHMALGGVVDFTGDVDAVRAAVAKA